MYQMDDDVKEILDAHGIRLKSNVDVMQFKTVTVDCPRCNAKIRVAFDQDEVKARVPGTGIANIILDLPCKHVFVASIDRNMKVRAFMEIDQGIHVTSERLDIRFLKDQERALKSLHEQLSNEDGKADVQFKVFQELTRVRKLINGVR